MSRTVKGRRPDVELKSMALRDGKRVPARRRRHNAAATVAATKTKTPPIPKPSKEARAARVASCAVSADTTAALVVETFSKSIFGEVFTEVVKQLDHKAKAVHGGDLRDGEALLMTQAIGLNAIYTELVVLARNNLEDHFDVAE